MRFDEFDQRMRCYETASDTYVVPEMYMVARLDGRSFTRLTKHTCPFEAPFDERFRDYMIETTKALMNCGFRIVFAFTQSDEISLLLDRHEELFGRKLRKYYSTLAGEASAQFSVKLGRPASFDCRISQLPNLDLVVDYFRWRSTDAGRNALAAWCYWTLRKHGQTERQATANLSGLTLSAKHELLFAHGINFNDLPVWQKRGVGLIWRDYPCTGFNPRTGESVATYRRRIHVDLELPRGDAYGAWITSQMRSTCPV